MITIYDWFGYDLPVTKRYGMIKAAGFDGVMVWCSYEKGDPDYRLQPSYARSAGLIVENMHTPFEHINDIWMDNPDGEALTDEMIRNVKDCQEFDIPVMIMHVSKDDNPPPYNVLGLDRFKRIAEKGEQLGVSIALENTHRADYLSFLLDRIDSPNVGFCYDSGHHHCFTPTVDLLSMFGSRLMALHLHDNDGTGDQHLLPFDGSCRWDDVMSRIAKTGVQRLRVFRGEQNRV